jgi:hypothetical protein
VCLVERARRAFDPPLAIRAPRDGLLPDLARAVDDEHRDARVREVRDALVADDGDELCARVARRERAGEHIRALAPRDAAHDRQD